MSSTKKKPRSKPTAASTAKPAKSKASKDVDPTLQAWERGDSIELAPDETEYSDYDPETEHGNN